MKDSQMNSHATLLLWFLQFREKQFILEETPKYKCRHTVYLCICYMTNIMNYKLIS